MKYLHALPTTPRIIALEAYKSNTHKVCLTANVLLIAPIYAMQLLREGKVYIHSFIHLRNGPLSNCRPRQVASS